MDSEGLQAWLDDKQRQDWGALRPHAEALYALLTSSKTPQEVSRALVADISSQPLDSDSDRKWRVWQLVFSAATELPQHHKRLVELVYGIHGTPPVHPEEGTNNRLVWDFWADWRDKFDGLKTHCHLNKQLEPGTSMPAHEARVNFTAFSAHLIEKGGSEFVDGIGVFAFFEIRDVLEATRENFLKDTVYLQGETFPSRVRSEELNAVLQWILHGGTAIRNMGNSSLGDFEESMRQPTDFWTGAPGMSYERWCLWRERLEDILRGEDLSESAREAAGRAVAVLRDQVHS